MLAGDGPDVDDPAGTARYECGRCGFAAVEAPGEVDVDDSLPELRRRLVDSRVAVEHAGAVDEDCEPAAVISVGRSDELLHRVEVGDIKEVRCHFGEFAEYGFRLSETICGHVADVDVIAGLRECNRDCLPDPRSRAGDGNRSRTHEFSSALLAARWSVVKSRRMTSL